MTTWCDNWRCPAMRSCALHFGRSKPYCAMELEANRLTRTLEPGRDHCAEYICDAPKASLLSPEMQGRMTAAIAMLGVIPRLTHGRRPRRSPKARGSAL